MKRIFVYLLFIFIPTACTPTNELSSTETAAWVQEYSMPSPHWLSSITACEEDCGFPLARCITILYADFATLTPDEDPLFFLHALSIEIDGQSVVDEDTMIAIQGEGISPSAQICVDTSDLEVGLHVGIIRIQLDNRINEMYSWILEISN